MQYNHLSGFISFGLLGFSFFSFVASFFIDLKYDESKELDLMKTMMSNNQDDIISFVVFKWLALYCLLVGIVGAIINGS